MRFLAHCAAACLLAVPIIALAQSADDARLRDVLAKAAANQQQLDAHAPSFVCHEEGFSRELHNGQEKHRTAITGELSVVRQPDGKLKEHFTIATLDGKPWDKAFNIPLIIIDGFSDTFSYFSPKLRNCLDFSLAADRLDFHPRAAAADMACKKMNPHLTATATLDPTGQVLGISQNIPPEFAGNKRLLDSALDIAPVTLGGEEFRISRHLYAEYQIKPGDISTFDATYSNCRLFHATVTIRGGDTPVDDQGNPLPPKP